jgi:hypothetical protein
MHIEYQYCIFEFTSTHYAINIYACVILSGIRLNYFHNWTSYAVWICGRYRINSYMGYQTR